MIILHFDGACEPINPGGTASWGYTIKNQFGELLRSDHGIVGKGKGMTNNVAEYTGLIEAIKGARDFGFIGTIQIYGDSSLVINMITKKWGWQKTRSGKNIIGWNPHNEQPHLRKLLDEVFKLLEGKEFTATWIPREDNAECDALSKIHNEKQIPGDML